MPSRNPTAGGILIALGAMLGAVAGVYRGQPTLGFLAGTGVGVVLALLIWLKDR